MKSQCGKRCLELKNVCVWNKNNAGMSTFYRSKHELVLVWKNGSAPHINNFELGQHGRYRSRTFGNTTGSTLPAAGRISQWIERNVPYTSEPMNKFLEGLRKAGLQ
jgi:hypothetical protein